MTFQGSIKGHAKALAASSSYVFHTVQGLSFWLSLKFLKLINILIHIPVFSFFLNVTRQTTICFFARNGDLDVIQALWDILWVLNCCQPVSSNLKSSPLRLTQTTHSLSYILTSSSQPHENVYILQPFSLLFCLFY